MEGTDADETLVAGIQKSITTTGMSRLGAGKALEDVGSRGWAMDKDYGSFFIILLYCAVPTLAL